MLEEVKPKVVVCTDSLYPLTVNVSQKIGGVKHVLTTSLSDFVTELDEKAPPEVKSEHGQAYGLSLVKLLEESKGRVEVGSHSTMMR